MRTWVTTHGPALRRRSPGRPCCCRPRSGSCRAWCPADRSCGTHRKCPQPLISMATPEVEPHEASTVFGVGSMMSISPLVRAHLEISRLSLTTLVGRPDHGRRSSRSAAARTRHAGAGAGRRLDDPAGRLVDHIVVVGLQPDADLLFPPWCVSFASLGGWGRVATRRAATWRTGLTGGPWSPGRRPRCSHPHGWRTADPRPWRRAGSVRRSSSVLSPGMTISVSSGSVTTAGHVRGPEVELRPVVVEERRVPAPSSLDGM